MALLAARDQGLAFLATTACSFVDFSTATLNRCAEGAFQLALRGLPESLVGSDTLMYGRWLWHYAFWDFFNLSFYRKCGSLCIEPFFP